MHSRDAGGAAAGEAPSRVTLAAPPFSRGAGPGVTRPPAPALGPDLVRVLQLARRRLRLAVLIAVLLTAAAAAVVLRLPNRYTAEALVVLNDRPSKLAELGSPTQSLISRTQADLSIVKTQTEILTSDATLRATAERLDLLHDPAFSPPRASPASPDSWRGRVGAFATWLTGREPTRAGEPPSLDDIVAKLGQVVTVVNEGGSYALHLRAETGDADLSAGIANTLAEVYLADQRDQQQRTLQAGSRWLSDRLRELRATVLRADDAVERYRAEHQLGQADAPSLLDSKISQLNSALIDASARLGRARANLAEADAATRRGGDLASAGSLLAPSLQALRQQEADILVRKSTLQQQYGPQHPQVAEIQAQLDASQARIRLEVDRIMAGLRSEVNATRGEVQNLQQQLAALEDRRAQQAGQQVQLAELEREARASGDVYAQLLTQFNTSQTQESGQQPDARLAAPARPPIEPSSPNRKLLLAGAAIASCGFGLLAAVALGILRGGFGGAGALEEATGLPTLEVLPELRRRQLRDLLARKDLPEAANPVRGLAFTLDAWLGQGEGGRVVLLTSSVAGEGKSLLALMLGRAFALAGRRTLVVDFGPWRPALGRLTGRQPADIAAGTLPLTAGRVSGLEVATLDTIPDRATRPHVIRRMIEGFPELRRAYDVVLLDAPPVLAVPDVLLAAAHADGTLLVVRFEGPRAGVVRASLDKLASVDANLIGTVLSRVDPRNYRRYGHGNLTYARPG